MMRAIIELHKAMVKRSKEPFDYGENEITISGMYHNEVFVCRGIEKIAEYLGEECEIKERGCFDYPFELAINKDGIRYYQLITAAKKESLAKEAENVKENCITDEGEESNVER
jgi:hypothetical protein